MNQLKTLLTLPLDEKKRRGVEYTPAEIAEQPLAWKEVVESLTLRAPEIASFLRRYGLAGRRRAVFVLAGAGTSEFIGNAVLHPLRNGLRREGFSLPTTWLITHWKQAWLPDQRYVLIHFSRSGESAESLETYRLAKERATPLAQLVITCNKDGQLARLAKEDGDSLCIVFPERTNDQSLVMTCSFTSMTLAALCLPLVRGGQSLKHVAETLGAPAKRILELHSEQIAQFAQKPFRRACFLGSGPLQGAMQECHLKLTEMTDGQIACRFDSFLGLRHGPRVFVNGECAIIASLSPDAVVRRYEMDLLSQLKSSQQGMAVLTICNRADDQIRKLSDCVIELFPEAKEDDTVTDSYRVVTDVVIGQLLGLFKCLALGLKPDNPSVSGVIHRVVQGVRIHRQK